MHKIRRFADKLRAYPKHYYDVKSLQTYLQFYYCPQNLSDPLF